MNKKKRNCKCHKLQHVCKKLNINDIRDVIEDIAHQAEKCKSKGQPPVFRTRPFKLRHPKEPCIPMTPSVHTRLKYIGHCDIEPDKVPASRASQPYASFDIDGTSDDSSKPCRHKGPCTCGKKCVRYSDLISGDITMPPAERTIQHTADDAEIFKVPSPKISGEVIHAEKVKYTKDPDYVPPLPSRSEHQLYRPHSGIIVNKDKYFAPPIVHFPAPTRVPDGKTTRAKMRRKRCHTKTCPHYQGQKGRKLRTKRRSGKKCLTGKLRRRGSRKRVRDDDSVCGIDEIPRPEHAQIPKNLKQGSIKTHSMTVLPCRKEQRADTHYGILAGSFNMFDSKFGKSRGKQALTMNVMAYCLAFHYHPKQWTIRLLDSVVEAGDKWYIQCLENLHDHSSVMGMCEVLPFNKKQTLVLNGKRMRVMLGEPDIVGYTMSKDPTIYNLCKGLKAFFKNNRAGVFLSRVLKVLVWKDRICYYIFDPAGRDPKAVSDFANGFAALMNVRDLKAVADIVMARTLLDDQKFVLAPVKVLKMVDEKVEEDFESEPELTQAEKAMMGYRILTDSSGIVNANMHAGDKSFEDAKFRQALPIAVVAMTYAKISPPSTWFSKTIDKILRLGTKLYRDCLHPKVVIDLTIDNIPNEITIGPYACEIIIYRDRIKGQLFSTKECLLNIKTGLDEFFSHGYNSGIIDFVNYTLAVWRQREMFYLFDPYPRSQDGLRTFEAGHACCFMLLNTEATADVFTKIWDYLPATTQFYIHAFKVLRLKKKEPKMRINCKLSDTKLKHKKVKRHVLHASHAKGDSKEVLCYSFPSDNEGKVKVGDPMDEEKLGDIVSLIDSVQEEYLPPIPPKYKHMEPEPPEEKIIDLSSPSVSATQVVPPWPKPRDKTNEPPEPDPSPEPTPPSTPSVVPEEEEGEEEEEENEDKAKEKEKEVELPPALPPPPPSPQSDSEPELALAQPVRGGDEEVETAQMEPPVKVDREILLNEDTQYRYKLRKMRRKITDPLTEDQLQSTALEDLARPSNFKKLPDKSQIIRGANAIVDPNVTDILPFVAIMAIVTSYKYTVNTWTPGLVDFIVQTGKLLYDKKCARFQLAPVHIIPKITIGQETYYTNIDVVAEGVTWQLEEILLCNFLTKYDRGMLTTATYSCAFFVRNDLFYLYDGTPCSPMGLRQDDNKGKACFLRYRTLHDLVMRIAYNKDGSTEDQHFILSRVIVRRLIKHLSSGSRDVSPKSRTTVCGSSIRMGESPSYVAITEPKSHLALGYQQINDELKIQGTTVLKDYCIKCSDLKSCHFVSLIGMLMATMHPLHTWDHTMVDICIEKGLEIYEKAANLNACEKRIIKNIILDGKIINLNLKRVIVINENPEKLLEQYLYGVLSRMKYVMVRFDTCTLAICKIDGRYHLFDPYPSPTKKCNWKQVSDPNLSPKKKDRKTSKAMEQTPVGNFAGWVLYETLDPLISRIKRATKNPDSPEFYTFELTSAKTAPRHAALNYRLSPLFKPDESPNVSYLKPRKIKPVVNEKMYWLKIETVPWSRVNPCNDLGIPRRIPKSLWKDWDIEFAGDLYSLWGTIHPKDTKFAESNRGKQYLTVSVVAIVMTNACRLSAWTGSLLDGIVEIGDKYHKKCAAKLGKNHEMKLEDLNANFDEMYPYSFTVKFEEIIFGFIYNIYPERFNLSRALVYFFEKNKLGILISPAKNLAFGKVGTSYFMFDCQSFGTPIFSPGQGASYILKCESLNRLVYCMTLTLNVKRHEQQFHLFSVSVTLNEKNK